MKTVTVRIPVAVDSNGLVCWGKGSSVTKNDNLLARMVASSRNNGFKTSERQTIWITAEVPVPEPTEVKGRVEG